MKKKKAPKRATDEIVFNIGGRVAKPMTCVLELGHVATDGACLFSAIGEIIGYPNAYLRQLVAMEVFMIYLPHNCNVM